VVVERPRDERPTADGETDAEQPPTDEETEIERPTALEETKAALRRLAGADPEAVVDRAAAAVEDLDAAVAFVEDVGVDELARAVESTDDPAVRRRGRRALSAFRRFRAAAEGDAARGHFHPGPGTDLRDGAETTTE
jgi:outer membrane murein-binding lipoprotein Lpp